MNGIPTVAGRSRLGALAGLLALAFAAPGVSAQNNNTQTPPPPTITSPGDGSTLSSPDRVTVRGTAAALTKGSVKVKLTHLQGGKRVSPWGGTVERPFSVSNGQWEVTLNLSPGKIQRGWQDVRYEISASVRWDKRPEQHHVSDASSRSASIEVFPPSQPDPLPTAPPAPVIQTPGTSTPLAHRTQFDATGTGTPGNRVQLTSVLLYALEGRPTYEHRDNTGSATPTVGADGKWRARLNAGNAEANYVNARVRVTAKEIHRENSALVSPEAVIEVPVEVPEKRAPTIQERALLPTGAGPIREPTLSAAQREALLHRRALITAPADGDRVSGTMQISGTAEPGSNLQVSVKRLLPSRAPARGGRPRPGSAGARTGQDLGTFTARANSSGEWRVRTATLPTQGADRDLEIEISVVEVPAAGSTAPMHPPHTVIAIQGD